MKARMSKKIQKILSTRKGREQLGKLIKNRQEGSIDLGNGEKYNLTRNAGSIISKKES